MPTFWMTSGIAATCPGATFATVTVPPFVARPPPRITRMAGPAVELHASVCATPAPAIVPVTGPPS